MDFDIKKIAKLAKLRITEEEEKLFTENIKSVIKMIDKLDVHVANEVGDEKLECVLLKDLKPMKYREDVVEDSMPNDELVVNSPKSMAGCIVVPKVLE